MPALAERLPGGTPVIDKTRCSACGVETHVCVNQTVHDLLARGASVHVAADATSSRTAANRRAGLDTAARAGAHVTSAEMVLFEMLGQAGGPEFKALSALVT